MTMETDLLNQNLFSMERLESSFWQNKTVPDIQV